MPNCPKCGARVDTDDEFCSECGAKTRQQPTEALPAREAQRIIIQQAQPKKHRFLTAVIIIIVIVFLFRACSSFSSEPQVYRPTQEVGVPAQIDRILSIDTPPPRVNPIPEPEPLPRVYTTANRPPSLGCPLGRMQLTIDESATYTITKSDSDGDMLTVAWKIDDEVISGETGDSYFFSKDIPGTYTLKAVVSDEMDERACSWTIAVTDSAEEIYTYTP